VSHPSPVAAADGPTTPAPADPDPRPPRRNIHDICAKDAEVGIAWCDSIATGDPRDCDAMCIAEFRATHPPPQGAPPAGGAAAASAPPDPYFFALADCIHRARGGEGPSLCRFASPLDQMDFGQKHCDTRCVELAGMSPGDAPAH
jgi:hypothetical protein